MPCQEITVGDVFCRHSELQPLHTAKMLVVIGLVLTFPQGGRKLHCVVVGRDSNEAAVESLVIKGGEKDAVAGVETLLFMVFVFPRDDMAGYQQLRDVDVGQGTTATVVGNYHTSEVFLSLSVLCLCDLVFTLLCDIEMAN